MDWQKHLYTYLYKSSWKTNYHDIWEKMIQSIHYEKKVFTNFLILSSTAFICFLMWIALWFMTKHVEN